MAPSVFVRLAIPLCWAVFFANQTHHRGSIPWGFNHRGTFSTIPRFPSQTEGFFLFASPLMYPLCPTAIFGKMAIFPSNQLPNKWGQTTAAFLLQGYIHTHTLSIRGDGGGTRFFIYQNHQVGWMPVFLYHLKGFPFANITVAQPTIPAFGCPCAHLLLLPFRPPRAVGFPRFIV